MQLLRTIPLLLICTAVPALAQDAVLIPFGATWKYLDNGSNQGTAWRATTFNDAPWASGPAELGYGDGDEATVVSFGPSSSTKYITTYFRNTVNIADVAAFKGFSLRIKRDDAFVLYINGTERMRQNFDQTTIAYNTLAYSSVSTADEGKLLREVLLPSYFQNGNNTIAVEVHQNAANSSDLSFDLELLALDDTPSLFRGPYLQATSSTSTVVCWKTDVPKGSRVRFGTNPGSLDSVRVDNTPRLYHELKINGLSPSTTYFYTIGTPDDDLVAPASDQYFTTHPLPGTPAPTRIWVVGDAGTGYNEQLAVRNSYLNHIANGPKADVWLMLGDNAYNHGRESEYQLGLFENMYEPILRNTCSYPAVGNHDYYSGANGNTNTGTYYSLFAPPKLGEAGGVPSNTEAYYSYDHGNIHFISLDSYGVSRSAVGTMATWLTNDIAQARTQQKWIIAYWHHPPYSKGSHDSDNNADSGGLMRDMRENIVPILENNAVDIVLCGHSHSYERSYLIDGHYGVSSTFNAALMRLDGTSGRLNGTGPYQKPGDMSAHEGTVYAVCGVSGKKSASGSMNHPAMFLSTYAHWGSMVIDVIGNTLSAKFINDQGVVVDHFDLRKSFGPVTVPLKAILEGPYDAATGLMYDSLRVQRIIPKPQPFAGHYAHLGEWPTQVMDTTLLDSTGANAAVDWVFVELRDAVDPKRIVAAKAALIQRDGDVTDTDGISTVAFSMPDAAYHVALRHRNHLGVMTAVPILLSDTTGTIDLTSDTVPAFGTDARRNVAGKMVLWRGDVSGNGTLQYTGSGNDRDPILTTIGATTPNNSVQGYLPDDTNMDGAVRYVGGGNDRDPILVNVGSTTPNNLRLEQLP